MKKIIILFIFLFLISSLFSNENTEIKDIKPPEQLKGTLFFPLFVGAKWEWNLKGMGNLTKAIWEIISAHTITDITNNIGNIIAFKLKATYEYDGKEITDEWYIFEYNGFICSYKKSRNNYYIEKILPINPSINDKWINASNKFEITEITNSSIKVELKNEELGRYGYQLFLKDVGPSEIFEYLIIDDKKQQKMMSLINNISYKDIPTIKYKEIQVIKKEEKITTNSSEKNNELQVSEDDYIYSLSKDKKYFQIGSFSVNTNAIELTLKSKKAGFVPKIFFDKDKQYKVLIEFLKEKSIIEKEIKEKLGIVPFLKQ